MYTNLNGLLIHMSTSDIPLGFEKWLYYIFGTTETQEKLFIIYQTLKYNTSYLNKLKLAYEFEIICLGFLIK